MEEAYADTAGPCGARNRRPLVCDTESDRPGPGRQLLNISDKCWSPYNETFSMLEFSHTSWKYLEFEQPSIKHKSKKK